MRPWTRLGEGRARLLGLIQRHESSMQITLRDSLRQSGVETRVLVEQPGEPPPLLPDRQPPTPACVGSRGTIVPHEEVRQHDLQTTFQGVLLAFAQALYLLGKVRIIERLRRPLPQPRRLVLRPGVKVSVIKATVAPHGQTLLVCGVFMLYCPTFLPTQEHYCRRGLRCQPMPRRRALAHSRCRPSSLIDTQD